MRNGFALIAGGTTVMFQMSIVLRKKGLNPDNARDLCFFHWSIHTSIHPIIFYQHFLYTRMLWGCRILTLLSWEKSRVELVQVAWLCDC